MPHAIFNRVQKWALEAHEDAPNFYEIFDQIEYLAEKRFQEYQPVAIGYPDFRIRLKNWLDGVADETDAKTMFPLVCHIFFVGCNDFNALYTSAYRTNVMRWLIDQESLSLADPHLDRRLAIAVQKTWFCSITDMQISNFYHVNNITGRSYRPDFNSLAKLGDASKVESFMNTEGILRLVLLEDFVGSGSQARNAVRLAVSLRTKPNILLLPLIVCPSGARLGYQLSRHCARITFSPVLTLDDSCLLGNSGLGADAELFAKFRDLAFRLYGLVNAGTPADPRQPPYGPLGFSNTGSMTVMYSNCPDNTLPLIHHSSPTWKPLFPRATRI